MKAWHFVRENKKLGYGDGRQVEKGRTLKVEGDPVLCKHGLHASERLIDALSYAPGPIVCRVEMGGKIIKGEDKIVAQERTVIKMADATDVLYEFACCIAEWALKARQAEGYEIEQASFDAIEARRKWLRGEIDDEALAAAEAAARSAAEKATWSSVEKAAEAAIWTVAWSAADTAAEAVTRSVAWSDALAEEEAVWVATRSVADTAVEEATRSAQNKELTKRIEELLEN